MFDGPAAYTPCRLEVLKDSSWGKHQGKLWLD